LEQLRAEIIAIGRTFPELAPEAAASAQAIHQAGRDAHAADVCGRAQGGLRAHETILGGQSDQVRERRPSMMAFTLTKTLYVRAFIARSHR